MESEPIESVSEPSFLPPASSPISVLACEDRIQTITKERLPQTPQRADFSEIQHKVAFLQERNPPFEEGIVELQEILHLLHDISKRESIPDNAIQGFSVSFYFRSLEECVENLVKRTSIEQLHTLCSLLNREFCPETYRLQNILYLRAKELDPHIQDLISPILLPDTYRPILSLNVHGAQSIATQKIAQRSLGVTSVETYSACDLDVVLNAFYETGQKRDFFLVSFDPTLQAGHFSPLIVEREGDFVHILSSDSVLWGSLPFTELVTSQMKNLPFPHRLYIVTEPRQHNSFTCSIFAIEDMNEVAKIMKREGSFFTYYQRRIAEAHQEELKPLREEDGNIPLELLPLGMLKMTESLSRVQELADRVPGFMSRSEGGKTLGQHLAKGTYKVRDRELRKDVPINLLAARKLSRAFETILDKLAKNEI